MANLSDVNLPKSENTFENNIRYKQLGKVLREFDFEQKDEFDVQLFVSHKFETEYGLKAFSNVTFCISHQNENEEEMSGKIVLMGFFSLIH